MITMSAENFHQVGDETSEEQERTAEYLAERMPEAQVTAYSGSDSITVTVPFDAVEPGECVMAHSCSAPGYTIDTTSVHPGTERVDVTYKPEE